MRPYMHACRILGKYGGVPALGAGITLPRLMKDSILKVGGRVGPMHACMHVCMHAPVGGYA